MDTQAPGLSTSSDVYDLVLELLWISVVYYGWLSCVIPGQSLVVSVYCNAGQDRNHPETTQLKQPQ